MGYFIAGLGGLMICVGQIAFLGHAEGGEFYALAWNILGGNAPTMQAAAGIFLAGVITLAGGVLLTQRQD